jgi:hypothetical protein
MSEELSQGNDQEVVSILDMPDDELVNFDLQAHLQNLPAEEETPAEEVEEPDVEEADEPAVEAEGGTPEDEDEGESADEEEDTAPVEDADEEEQEEPKSVDTPADAIDFEAEYKKIVAPFKANGKDMQVKSADDIVALMQMGANYNKKMAALKPNLKLMKLLENNGLLSEEKLSFLIDLDKKNPEAISKLVKDSGIDPLDMDVNKESGYKPKTYTVDDRELELDSVLEGIQETPTYARTINVVSTKWDGPSKQAVVNTPQLLRVINDHISSGVYDLISNEVERERMFGRLKGVSDIEAYRTVGDSLDAKGAFNHLGNQGQQQPAAKQVIKPAVKAEDPNLRAKKRAASTTKAVPANKVPVDYNPLSLSDEEFSKSFNSRLL